MNKELQKVTKEWMKLERKTLEQRKEADRYYDEHLMDLIRKDYIARNKGYVREEAEHLIVSVGTSYEPIVLNISLFEPKKVMFLYTEKSCKRQVLFHKKGHFIFQKCGKLFSIVCGILFSIPNSFYFINSGTTLLITYSSAGRIRTGRIVYTD